MCRRRTSGKVFVKNKRKGNLRYYRKAVEHVDKRPAMLKDRYFSFFDFKWFTAILFICYSSQMFKPSITTKKKS